MFLLPLVLWGAVAAGVPLALHLWRSRRAPEMAWGAMEFLLASESSWQGWRNLQHWLLLLLRMLLCALAAVLFAWPVAQGPGVGNVVSSADLAIVLDHSLTMQAKANGTTRWDHALDQATQLLATLRGGDRVSVILADPKPEVLLRQATPTTAKDTLAALRQRPPQAQFVLLSNAVGQAYLEVRAGKQPHKNIVVISDHQRSNWLIGNEAAWQTALPLTAQTAGEVQIYSLPVRRESYGDNIRLGALRVLTELPLAGGPIEFELTVHNQGQRAVTDLRVSLEISGQPGGQSTIESLAAGQSQSVTLRAQVAQAGPYWFRAKVTRADELGYDNSTLTALAVWDKLPVTLVTQRALPNDFLASALQILSQRTPLALQRVNLADAPTAIVERPGLVILDDPAQINADLRAALNNNALAGHGTWLLLGTQANLAQIQQSLRGLEWLPAEIGPRRQWPADTPQHLLLSQHPLWQRTFAELDANTMAGAWLRQAAKLESPRAGAQWIMTSADETPLGVYATGTLRYGRSMIWACAPEAQENNLAVMRNFLPLVHACLLGLAARPLDQPRDVPLGTIFTLPEVSGTAGEVILTNPEGNRTALPVRGQGKQRLVVTPELSAPGLYALTPGGGTEPQAYLAVQPDPREFDPAVLSAGDIEWLKQRYALTEVLDSDGLPQALGKADYGTPLWPWLVIIVATLLVLESWAARRAARWQVDG